MGSLFIQTAIDANRVQSAGQPPWETIEVDAFFSFSPLLLTPYAETVRFSDYLRRGGESVRYYHLTAYARGLTLSLSPSSQGRIISGIYESRELAVSRQPLSIYEAIQGVDTSVKPLPLMRATHILLGLEGGGRLIYRLNCLESFADHFALSGSLRIPEFLLHGHPAAGSFSQLINQHLLASDPLFTPHSCRTIDASVCLDVDPTCLKESRAILQVAGEKQILLPLVTTPEIL